MSIAYTIISIDESRADYKEAIRANVDFPEVVGIRFVDGRDPAVDTDSMRNKFRVWDTATRGELGIWASNMNTWSYVRRGDYDTLVVFEDDAIVVPDFATILKMYVKELPDDWDAMALFIPEGQRALFRRHARVKYVNGYASRGSRSGRSNQFEFGSKWLARVYQEYSCVAMMYSRAGAERILDLVNEKGMYTPVDLFLFEQAHMGMLNIYAPKPESPRIVEYNWNIESIRAKGENGAGQ